MENPPPPRLNRFILAAVILFNLLWLTLLFLSCRPDPASQPTPTPESGIEARQNGLSTTRFSLDTVPEADIQIWGTRARVFEVVTGLTVFPAGPLRYNVPLYSPPSTCNSTPVT